MSAYGLRAFSGLTIGVVGGLIGIHWSLALKLHDSIGRDGRAVRFHRAGDKAAKNWAKAASHGRAIKFSL